MIRLSTFSNWTGERGLQLGLEADIVVGEFAHLALVDANNLGLLRHPHPQAWDIVHDPEYDGLNHVRIAPNFDKGKLTVTTNE
jgi:hypothetical protein